jgi:urea ABC transporter ATP-binding protein UrtE
MLKVDQLTAGYGSAQVLNGVDLDIKSKEVVALLGRNGVVKTTLLKSIMGILPARSGRVLLDGEPVEHLPTFAIARRGMSYVPQGRGIFDKLSVEENLRMGLRACRTRTDRIPDFIYEKFPILHERRQQLAGSMSGGQKQQLAISRALCSDPKVLLLDEPSEGIQPNIVQDIGRLIRELVTQRDIAVVLVEQNLELVRQACDRFCIMVKGQVVHAGQRAELDDEHLLATHLSV